MLSGMLFEGETNCVQQDSHGSTIIGNQIRDSMSKMRFRVP